jgi:hypothetical protein
MMKQLRTDPLDMLMRREGVAAIASRLEHHGGPEVRDDSEVLGPRIIRDGSREHGTEDRGTPEQRGHSLPECERYTLRVWTEIDERRAKRRVSSMIAGVWNSS